MKVRVGGAKESVVSEMVDVDEPEIGFILEMLDDPSKLADFGFNQSVVGKASALKAANDGFGEFPVLRVEEGWSNNRRLWDGRELDGIAEQTNVLEPVGHLGHIPSDLAATAMPEPQTTWIGAFTKIEPSELRERKGEPVKVIYLAGSNLPSASVRTFIKNRAVRGISWWGRAKEIPVPGQGVKVEGFKLLAIDWARKLSEGMPTARIVAVTGEQTKNGGSMDKELAQVTPEEFKKENPNGYQLLVTEATAESDKKIGEMQEKIDAADEDKQLLAEIRKELKLSEDANPLEKIVALMARLGSKAKETVDNLLDEKLAELVPDEEKRKLVKRLMPVSEMESKVADAKDADEAEKIVSEMAEGAANDDEMIKTYVSEQSPPIVRRREEIGKGGDSTENAVAAAGAERVRTML